MALHIFSHARRVAASIETGLECAHGRLSSQLTAQPDEAAASNEEPDEAADPVEEASNDELRDADTE